MSSSPDRVINPPRRLSLQNSAWAAAFVIAGALATTYLLLFDGIISRRDNLLDQLTLRASPGPGLAFCLMPLALAVIPPALGRWFFRHSRAARRLATRGDVRGALEAYRQQIELINRFPTVDRMRDLFFISAPGNSFREDFLLDMAHLHLLLNDPPRATACLWRCLHYNAANGEALALLDQIRRIPQDGLKGW